MTAADGPPHPTGQVWTTAEDGGLVLHLRGEVDSAAVARYEKDATADEQVVAVDAGEVTFLNSAGLVLVVRLTKQRREAGHRPVLRSPTPAVLQVLRLTGTDSLFELP